MLHIKQPRDLMLLLILVTCFISQVSCKSLRQKRTWPNRNYPGDIGFPTLETIARFARQLDGHIITPDNSTSYNDANQVYNRRMKQRPALIVRAKSIQDVQRVILFSRRYNLHLTVRSSGHEFIGRNSHDGSINLDMSQLKEVTVNLNSRRNKAGEVTAQSGASWADVYQEVDKAFGPCENGEITGRIVVGGYCTTVAVGGYFQGGGHSPIAREYGMGVDNLLEATVVTADGRIRVVNETHVVTYEFDGASSVSENREFYWALRGGGPMNTGVIFSYTFKLHCAPQRIRRLTLVILTRDLLGNEINKETVKFAHEQVNQLSTPWGGYICLAVGTITEILKSLLSDIPASVLSVVPPIGRYGVMVMLMNHVGSGSSPSNNELDALRSHPGVLISFDQFLPTYWSFAQSSLNTPYADSYTFGSIIPNQTLSDSAILIDFVDHLYYMIGSGTFVTITLIGGNMDNAEEGSTSVNPALRQGKLCASCFEGFPFFSSSFDPRDLDVALAKAQKLYTFGTGTYLNEAAEDLLGWKSKFWGDEKTYDRLVKFKKTVDPTNYMYCQNCVGSDLGDSYGEPNPGCYPGEPAYTYSSSSVEYDQIKSTSDQNQGNLFSLLD